MGVKRHEQNRSCLTLFMYCLTCSFNALIKLLWLLCKYQFCETVYSSHSSFFLNSSQIAQDPAHKLLNSLRVCLLCTWSFFHLFVQLLFFFFFTSLEPAELTLFKVLTLISTVRKCVMGLCARLGFPYTQILHTNNSDDEWCTLMMTHNEWWRAEHLEREWLCVYRHTCRGKGPRDTETIYVYLWTNFLFFYFFPFWLLNKLLYWHFHLWCDVTCSNLCSLGVIISDLSFAPP